MYRFEIKQEIAQAFVTNVCRFQIRIDGNMCQKQSPAATKPAARAVRPNTDLPTHVFNFAGLLTYEWPDDGSPTATSPPSAGGGEVAVGDPSSGRAFGAASLDSIGRTCKKNMLNHAVPSGTADWEASTHSKGNNCTACLLHQKCLRETTGFQSSHKKKKNDSRKAIS